MADSDWVNPHICYVGGERTFEFSDELVSAGRDALLRRLMWQVLDDAEQRYGRVPWFLRLYVRWLLWRKGVRGRPPTDVDVARWREVRAAEQAYALRKGNDAGE